MATIAISGLILEGASLLNDSETFLDMLKDDELAGVVGGYHNSGCGSSNYSHGGGYSGGSHSGGSYSGGSSFESFSGFFKSNAWGNSCY